MTRPLPGEQPAARVPAPIRDLVALDLLLAAIFLFTPERFFDGPAFDVARTLSLTRDTGHPLIFWGWLFALVAGGLAAGTARRGRPLSAAAGVALAVVYAGSSAASAFLHLGDGAPVPFTGTVLYGWVAWKHFRATGPMHWT